MCVCVTGMLNLLVGALVNVLCCRYKWGMYGEAQDNGILPRPSVTPNTPSASLSAVNPIYDSSPSAAVTDAVHLVAGPSTSVFDT